MRKLIQEPRRRWRLLIAVGIIAGLVVVCQSTYSLLERRSAEERLYNQAHGYWQRGEYSKAVRSYELLLAAFPSGRLHGRVLLETANTYHYYLRNVHRSIDLYKLVLAEAPKGEAHLSARRSLAAIYYRDIGDLTQAIKEYEALRDEEPTDRGRQEAIFALAEIHFRLNDLTRARKEYWEVASSPNDPHLQSKADLRIGAIFQLQGKLVAAESPFRRVASTSACRECRHQARIGLVDVLEAQEKFDEALQVLETPDDSPEMERFKAREIERIQEKRSILQSQITVDWNRTGTPRPRVKE